MRNRITVTPWPLTYAVAYLTVLRPWASFVLCAILVTIVTILGLIALPVVWSRRKYRRDAALTVAKLVIESCRSSSQKRKQSLVMGKSVMTWIK